MRQHTLYGFHLWKEPPIVIPQHAARPINFILSMFLIRPFLRLWRSEDVSPRADSDHSPCLVKIAGPRDWNRGREQKRREAEKLFYHCIPGSVCPQLPPLEYKLQPQIPSKSGIYPLLESGCVCKALVDRWDMNKHKASRGLKSVWALGLVCSCC